MSSPVHVVQLCISKNVLVEVLEISLSQPGSTQPSTVK